LKLTAKSVGGNQFAARAHVDVLRFAGQAVVGDEFVGDNLEADELTNVEQIVPGDTEQEGHRVADVAKDELQGKVRLAILGDVDISSPPAQEAVDQADQGDNAKKSSNNHAGNFDTQPRTVGEGVQGVCGSVLVVIGDHNSPGSNGLLGLGVSHLRHSQTGRNGHDTARHQCLWVQTEANVRHKHGTSDGGKTRAHDLVDFGQGQVRDERSNQHGGFTLSDEGRSSSHHGLGAGHAQTPEEEDGEFADEPLEDAIVVQNLDKRNEEDDRRDDTSQEPVQIDDTVGRQERSTLVGETEQCAGQERDEVENIVAGLCSQDKDGNDELGQHAANDRVPSDLAAISRCDVEQGKHHCQTEQRDSSVSAGVVIRLFGHKRAHENDRQGHEGSQPDAQLLGDDLIDAHTGVVPDKVHGLGDDRDGHPEEDQAERDGQIEEEGLQPAEVVGAVEDETGDPPADRRTSVVRFKTGLWSLNLPGEQQPNEEVNKDLVLRVQVRGTVFLAIFLGAVRVDTRRVDHSLLGVA
jgi:hypothetical protein